MLTNRFFRFRHDTQGAAAVEVGLAFPFIVMFASGLFEFGSLFYNFELIQTGVREAARYLARVPNPSAAETAARNLATRGTVDATGTLRVKGWQAGDITITYETTPNPVDAETGQRSYRGGDPLRVVRVSTEFNYSGLGLLKNLWLTPTKSAPRMRNAMSASRRPQGKLAFWRDQSGAVAVEFGLMSVVFITMLLGLMEFGTAYWQWNQASKALQLGVRLAAVSNPVSSDLTGFTGLSSTVEEGDPMPYFKRTCSGATVTCTDGTYDAAAMRTIVYGRGNTSCPTTAQRYPPMCQIFPRITSQNVIVEYTQTGLGFAGRPGGPLPSITIRLTGLDFNFVVLDSLIGLTAIPMTGLSASAPAEDLRGS